MNYKEIKRLMDDMGESKLDSLKIEFPDGIKISMTKGIKNEMVTNMLAPKVIEANHPVTAPVVQVNTENKLVNVSEQEENLKVIKSPMVGTFYSSSSPDKEAFVKIGDKISKGQVVCIIEAMKLMNEIESEFDGEIVEVCVQNEDVVEYGSPLFKIK